MHRNRRRPNGGRDQLRPDYLNPKSAYLYEFAKPMGQREIDAALSDWANRRPRRKAASPAASS